MENQEAKALALWAQKTFGAGSYLGDAAAEVLVCFEKGWPVLDYCEGELGDITLAYEGWLAAGGAAVGS